MGSDYIPDPNANYPLPKQQWIHKYTAGVWLDVHHVLVRDHDFPEMKPNDLARLTAAIFNFLYEKEQQ